MNLTEEKKNLEKVIDDLTNQIASLQLALSVNKSKLKKLTKLIEQSEEILK